MQRFLGAVLNKRRQYSIAFLSRQAMRLNRFDVLEPCFLATGAIAENVIHSRYIAQYVQRVWIAKRSFGV